MKHIKTLATKNLCASAKNGGCGECQTSCQSACKTSCGIANQKCESKNETFISGAKVQRIVGNTKYFLQKRLKKSNIVSFHLFYY